MNIRKQVIKTISTFFYLGYLPLIPGTFASLFGIFIFYQTRCCIFLQVLLTLIFMLLGFLVTTEAERIFNQKDAKYIVIDEVAGMLLALLFIPYNIKLVIIAFVLFRILDTFKPYPADKLQDLKGSLGIMGDDIMAGIYTNLILQIVLRVASFRAS